MHRPVIYIGKFICSVIATAVIEKNYLLCLSCNLACLINYLKHLT